MTAIFEEFKPVLYTASLQLAVYADDLTLGVYSDPIEAVNFQLKFDTDIKRITGNQPDNWGQTLARTPMPKPTGVEFELSSMTRLAFAAALMGQDVTFSQSAAPSQTATVVLSRAGWTKIGDDEDAKNFKNVTITGKVEGVDFAVLPKSGMIKALNDATAGSQTVGYDLGATAGFTVDASTKLLYDFAVVGSLKNQAPGGGWGDVRIPKISVSASDVFKLIQTDHMTVKFTGELIKLPNDVLARVASELVYS
jgi:hypothetical protein